ncbi:MAG: hypothetical protein COY80_03325 [Candidatus Pacebacteria bacterium CG_4_10_14_0_8_um_filter_42_14]|nr:MAG: hypothetical protein COY80_03325 [Candidatus Pacebacteria bacterium CG_4_10_14_0_8_um_filter_42_14]
MRKLISLNLGCGQDKRAGFVNVDIDRRSKPDIIHDLAKPLPFPSNSASEILLQDVLEHFTLKNALKLLKECRRVLMSEGEFIIRVPNVGQILKKYKNQPDLAMLFLYGDTSKSEIWGTHKYGYTPRLMQEIAEKTGFMLVNTVKEDTNFVFKLIKINLSQADIIVLGSGWKPSIKQLKELTGKGYANAFVATDLYSYLSSSLQRGKIIWFLSSPPSDLIGKVILRPLSKRASLIIVKNKKSQQYVRNILKYSHLRTQDATSEPTPKA